MKLYKIENGFGDYWVVAEHPTQAEEKLLKYLNDADYGFSEKRQPKTITLIAESTNDIRFITGKNFLP